MSAEKTAAKAIVVPVITGPTCSGKSALVEEVFTGAAAAGTAGGAWRRAAAPAASQAASPEAEIISADSMQVYRGLDIGTAKPSPELRAVLPHHLIDIREPDEQFNAGDFVRLALEACAAIAARGRLPVICGGTFFYLANLLGGLSEAPPASGSVRQALKTELQTKGAAALMDELRSVDGESAGRIHINDTYRLLRALEVFRLTGKPLSAFKRNGSFTQKPAACGGAKDGTAKDGSLTAAEAFRFVPIAVVRERAALYRRINARVKAMMEQGLASEAARLFARGFTPDAPGLSAIGYREFFYRNSNGEWRFTGGPEVPAEAAAAEDGPAESVAECIARNTRRYAKRQLTWLRSLRDVPVFHLDAYPAASAAPEFRRFLEEHGI